MSIWSATLLLFGCVTGHVMYMFFEQLWITEPRYCLPGANPRFPKILCYVNTYPAVFEQKALHVQHTWARRCDNFVFTSTVNHDNLSLLILNISVPETKSHLWMKMRAILRELYKISDQYDFFFKADDDTFAVVDNLRTSLWFRNPEDPFMTGYRWNTLCPGGYFSGGAGYLLSRAALKRIVELAIDRHPQCPTTDEDMEDVKMCLCGRAVGIRLDDEVDRTAEQSLFSPYNPLQNFNDVFLAGELRKNYHRTSVPFVRRQNLLYSSRHISFHYVEGQMMYIMEFLLYFMDPLTAHTTSLQKSTKPE